MAGGGSAGKWQRSRTGPWRWCCLCGCAVNRNGKGAEWECLPGKVAPAVEKEGLLPDGRGQPLPVVPKSGGSTSRWQALLLHKMVVEQTTAPMDKCASSRKFAMVQVAGLAYLLRAVGQLPRRRLGRRICEGHDGQAVSRRRCGYGSVMRPTTPDQNGLAATAAAGDQQTAAPR